jgi:hypothetical protein
MQVIDPQQLPIVLKSGPFELRMCDAGDDFIVNFMNMPGGFDSASDFVGLPDDRCQVPHYGMVLKGRIYTDSAQGRQEYGAGDVFYWAPGHTVGAVEDSEYFDFAPKEGFLNLIEHVKQRAETG